MQRLMPLVNANLELEDETMIEQRYANRRRSRIRKHRKWLNTFTKIAITVILFFALLDLQLTYILAFMGKDQIAESLSSDIATTIVGVMLGYFLKSLFETFFEKREERLRNDQTDNYEEV